MRIRGKGAFLIPALFLLPSFVGFIVFSLIPMISSLGISFTVWDAVSGPPKWIGLENYEQILRGEEFWRVLRNTLYFIVLYLPLILVTSLAVAHLLNGKARGIGAYRVIYYIPVLTSWVAGSLVWRWLLSPEYGPINALLGYFGITGPGWLHDRNWAMPGIVIASIWKDMGFFGLILLGGLQGINPSYYEAAEIDGASGWQKTIRITLPLLSPSLLFVIVISLINSFQLFPQVMIMTKGGPLGATAVVVERIYQYAFRYYKMGYACGYSWLLFVIIFAVTLVQMRMQKRWVHYES
ncbi:MAG: sugar ABC transporter permease [Firmicutes bacterium]|nr:sugar ABC transporter permease [Bacillota bacterium]MDH7496256.1 sugar ABC transporter permease [Bacillota bacterium]